MTTSINRPMNAREWPLLLALTLLWGGSFFFTGVAVTELPPFSLVLARVGLAALILQGALVVLGRRPPWRHWRAFLVMGLLNNALPFSLIVWGQTTIASGLAAILNATTPLFTVLLAHAVTADEKLSGPRLLGCALGLAGVALMLGPDVGELGGNLWPQLAVLAAALSYACAGVWGRRFAALGLAPVETATGQVTASTLLLLPLVLLADRPWTLAPPGAETWAAIAGLALLSTALGYVVYFRLLASAGATNLLLVTLLMPPLAVWLGFVFLGESLGIVHLAGLALIAAGPVAIDGRLLAILKKGRRHYSRPKGSTAV
ncbi:MAG TPA: DMT family transporter [Alphaproteobacteria bacterium]|jgi:drug/metabolite transporter (DMT)-like permease|nr:DMT family transporter [Alphaproteobacteria bacterium]MDP7164560.1 DMT family transporter [Alphaproteobacteria bacterium]MDP7427401.1 DMT family transporter [Alphaproteobacteria bacterium]HJM48972.1 DMT family transporter [Alphaproteobacteria bacterium]